MVRRDRLLARAAVRAAVRGTAGTAAALVTACLLGGCGLLGGPTAAQQNDPQVMTVTSPEFGHGNAIPGNYTCRGRGESPPITWSDAPTSTKALALVMDDADTPISPYIYWIVFNIGTQTPDVQAGRLPPGALQAHNSKGSVGYAVPCPKTTHKYRFTVYALNAPLRLPEGASLTAAWSAIASHAIGYGRMEAVINP